MRQLLTVKELKENWKVSQAQIYKMVRNRRIPYLMVEGCIRFDPVVIEKWLDSKQVKTKNIA